MSADNWTICPRCEIELANAREAELEKVNSLYG